MVNEWELPEEEIGRQAGRVPRKVITESNNGGDMARAKKPRRAVQQELIENARQTTVLPKKLRNLLAPLCEAEETAGASRLQATGLLKQIQTFMAELSIPQVALPNGGKVVYSETKAARYVAPKKSKTGDGENDAGDDSDDEE